MAINKKQILMKKKYQNGDIDIIYPVNRPKDIVVGGGSLEEYINKIDDISTGTNKVPFTQSSTRSNISTSDTSSTIFGKISKWFSDLKALAFLDKIGVNQLDTALTAEYNKRITTSNVTTSLNVTEPGFVADARAVNTLSTNLDNVNSNLAALTGSLNNNIYTAFNYNPAEWIPADGGFSFDIVSIDKDEDHTYAPPTTIGDAQDAAWWNVLTFGTKTRCTQIADFGYQYTNNDGLIFIRSLHNGWASGWNKIV